MEPFSVHTGTAVPLRRSNVDTDQIIPAAYLKRVARSGFEDGLFSTWRASDPDFVLNQPRYAHASILVVGMDFGTGSSREHAVWALRDYGFKAVIAPRFGDIFRGNSLKAGLLTVVLDEKVVQRLWDDVETEPTTRITVDLRERQVRWDAPQVHAFELGDYTRWRLLEGLDDIDLTMLHSDEVAEYQASRKSWLPSVTQTTPTITHSGLD